MTELLLDSTAPGPERGGPHGAWIGQVAHRAYQRSAQAADLAYEVERPLRETLHQRGWRVTLRGRADGVRRETAGFVVEELKSATACEGERATSYRLQAALYARMVERARSAPARAELVWLGGPTPVREPVELCDADVDRALRAALDARIEGVERRAAARAQARRHAAGIRFPFPAERPGQAKIARAVEQALAGREAVLIEAATGSGKSAAVLTPALAFTLAHELRLVVLSASTLQQHGAIDTLRRLAPGGMPLATRLRARARMCERSALPGVTGACPGCASAVDGDPCELVGRCFDGDGLALPDAVHAVARRAGVCPWALQREVSQEAPVIVCDLNYAIDPAVRLAELEDREELGRTLFVVDEAHRLAERAREANSVALGAALARRALEAGALGGDPLGRELREIAESLRATLADCAREAGVRGDGDWRLHDAPLAALGELARASDALALRAALRLAGTPPGPLSPVFELAASLGRFVAHAEAGEPGFVSLVGLSAGEPCCERFCLDPAPALARLFGGCRALVGCSATLSPPELHLANLGLPRERSVHVSIPPEDRSARRAVVIDAGVTSAEAKRAHEAPRIARRLAALARAVPGNCLALFPSFRFLDEVRAALAGEVPALRWQRAGDGEDERSALLAELRQRRDLLVLSVAGGGLSEGVDTAGAGLAAVAVIGPCLPAPSARRALLAEHYEERFGRGFELAYALPGMIRVVQSAGRLLRTDAERGVIALYDRRFLREPYRSLLPPEWLAGRPLEALRGDPAAVARRFFSD